MIKVKMKNDNENENEMIYRAVLWWIQDRDSRFPISEFNEWTINLHIILKEINR